MRLAKVNGIVAAAVVLAGLGSTAEAKEYRVAMLNMGPDGAMAFSPAYLKIAPGDDVLFVAQDKAHNVQSISGFTPAGATEFKGALSKDLKVKFTKAGLYGYECLPHFAMGMVGLIQVGRPVNKGQMEAATAKLPPMALARMKKYLAQAR